MEKNKGRILELGEKAIDQPASRSMVVDADDVIALDSILDRLETIKLQFTNLERSPDDQEGIHSIFRNLPDEGDFKEF